MKKGRFEDFEDGTFQTISKIAKTRCFLNLTNAWNDRGAIGSWFSFGPTKRESPGF